MMFVSLINDLRSLILIKLDCNQLLVVVGQMLPSILKEINCHLDATRFVLQVA